MFFLGLSGEAVMAYNRGAAITTLKGSGLGQLSYYELLQKAPNGGGRGFSATGFGYWLAVKDRSWQMRGRIGGYIPYVSFVWRGGEQADQIPALDENNEMVRNEKGEVVLVDNPNAGEEWCFVYGEKQWRAGISYDSVLANGLDLNKEGEYQVPMGRVSCG